MSKNQALDMTRGNPLPLLICVSAPMAWALACICCMCLCAYYIPKMEKKFATV